MDLDLGGQGLDALLFVLCGSGRNSRTLINREVQIPHEYHGTILPKPKHITHGVAVK